jgi:hypothetical protein
MQRPAGAISVRHATSLLRSRFCGEPLHIWLENQSMIPKRHRFSEKIMLKQKAGA